MVMARCNVLVVENDDALREEVAEFLEENGYRVDAMADGPAALEYLRQHAPDNLPDVILLDFWMPQMNGREVKAELRKDPALSRFAVNATTAIRESAGSFLSSAFTSRPFIWGIQKSSGITSGRLSGACCRRYSKAAGPSAIASTRYPFSSRNSATSSRRASSFSTTKTLHLAITHPAWPCGKIGL